MQLDVIHNTEPILLCNDGTQRTDMQFGALSVHDFTLSTGVQQITASECSIFLLGSGVTVTDVWEGDRQRQHTYTAGDLIFLPAKTDIRADYVSHAYSETMVRIPCALLLAVAEGLVDPAQVDLRYCSIDGNANFGVTAAVRNIARANPDTPALPILIEAMTTALAAGVLCVLSMKARAEAQRKPSGLSDARRRHAIDFIEANLHRQITLADIASAAAMSLFHFNRSFKASMGVTPLRYVLGRRIAAARTMMLATDIPLAQVAHACGFPSQSHFTTVFKAETGTTPAAWRRSVI